MSKALRWSEKWFRRGLWLLAFVFAWFLIGLGSTIVGDLPQVEQQRTLDDFLDPQRAPALKAAIREADRSERDLQAELEQLQLQQQAAQANHRAARDSFQQWLATRTATQRPDQDDELVERTRTLDGLRKAEREALAAVEARQQSLLDTRQGRDRAQTELQQMTEDAQRRQVEASVHRHHDRIEATEQRGEEGADPGDLHRIGHGKADAHDRDIGEQGLEAEGHAHRPPGEQEEGDVDQQEQSRGRQMDQIGQQQRDAGHAAGHQLCLFQQHQPHGDEGAADGDRIEILGRTMRPCDMGRRNGQGRRRRRGRRVDRGHGMSEKRERPVPSSLVVFVRAHSRRRAV